jgi:hypothetical protein
VRQTSDQTFCAKPTQVKKTMRRALRSLKRQKAGSASPKTGKCSSDCLQAERNWIGSATSPFDFLLVAVFVPLHRRYVEGKPGEPLHLQGENTLAPQRGKGHRQRLPYRIDAPVIAEDGASIVP